VRKALETLVAISTLSAFSNLSLIRQIEDSGESKGWAATPRALLNSS
jgi:hypothetical protein